MESDCGLASCCGRCFRPVSPSVGGFILSCSCFVCFSCTKTSSAQRVTMCPACGKKNIQALNLSSDDLPDEVQARIMSPLSSIERVCETLKDHIQYYKQTTQRMRAKIIQLTRENTHMKEILSGGPERQRQPNQPFQNPSRPQTSLSSVLSNPISAATLPPPVSVLGKRPDTNQSQQQQQRPMSRPVQQSAHFQNGTPMSAVSMAEPAAKRAQTAQALNPGGQSRPGTSAPNSMQRVEVSRPALRDPQLYQQPHLQQQQLPERYTQSRPPTTQHNQSQQSYPPGQGRSQMDVSPPRQLTASSSSAPPASEEDMWSFGGSAAVNPPPTASASVSHAVTPRLSENDRYSDNMGMDRERGREWGEEREQYRDSRESMPPPPSLLDRPPSNPAANRSPLFMTPSRLRSPHNSVPRVGSSGSGGGTNRPGSGARGGSIGGLSSNRPGSGAGSGSSNNSNNNNNNGLGGVRLGSAGKQAPANPLQGVGVTLSQHQMPPSFGAVNRG